MLQAVLDKIDDVNRSDPNRLVNDGQETTKELLYSRRMTDRLHRFHPDPPDILQIAARAQHVQRWIIPRSDYPMTRVGYRKWREDLGVHHGEVAARIMAEEGYGETEIEEVRILLTKKDLKSHPGTQALEDVICLVFLEHYLADFAEAQPEEKLIAIIRKTWKKMSDRGHEAALALELPEPSRRLVARALE